MKPETLTAIVMLLKADGTVDAGKLKEVVAVCRREQKHRKLVTVRVAAEALGCHPRTVARYARLGLLSAVRFGPRKIRYDMEQVEAFANGGVDAVRAREEPG